MRVVFLLLACVFLVSLSSLAQAAGRRVIVAVGSNDGLDYEVPLTYAERDAERFANVMVELGGAVGQDVTVVKRPTPRQLLQVLHRVGEGLTKDSMLVVYYSGHGSESALHMQGESLAVAELRAAAEAASAGMRLIVIDACRDADMKKGFSRVEPFAISLTQELQQRGVVMMQSAGPGEVALESNRLRAGLFSYYLISGLRGAADRDADGRVSISEAYDFAYGRTLRQSAGSMGRLQHPSIQMDVEGSGPLVLTSVAPTQSLLTLPAGKDVRYVVFEKGSQAALAEAWSQPERPTQVALPAGQFIVQERSEDANRITEVTLPFGGSRRLSRTDFIDASAEELTQRGGRQVLRQNRLTAAFGITLDDSGRAGEGGQLSYARAWNPWRLTLGLGATRRQFDVGADHVQREAYSVLGGAEYELIFERLNVQLGAGLMATLHEQELSMPPRRDRDRAFGGGPYARAGLSLPLTPGLAWELSVLEVGALFNRDQGPGGHGRSQTIESLTLLASGLSLAF